MVVLPQKLTQQETPPIDRVVDSRAAFQPVLLPDRQLEDQSLSWLTEPLAGEEQRSHDLLLHGGNLHYTALHFTASRETLRLAGQGTLRLASRET